MPRGIAVGLTFALLVGAQMGLEGIPVPAFASNRSVIRELDPLMLERFALPPAADAAPEPDEEQPAETPDEAEEVTTVSFDEEVGAAVQQLEELFAEEPAAPTPGRADASPDETGVGGISEELPTDRFESLFGADEGLVAGRTGARRPSQGRGGAGIGLGIEERPAGAAPPGDSGSPTGAPNVAVRTGASRTGPAEGEELDIDTHDPEAFTGSEADRLGVWMREHPAELPVGVRVHMNYEPSFLTSATVFVSDGKEWELYLMYNPALREVHVVLVQGDHSVYLIDRGFQEQSRSLREGTVRRTGGRIVAIDSRSGAASSEQASQFYDVFLSWWGAARTDVGGD